MSRRCTLALAMVAAVAACKDDRPHAPTRAVYDCLSAVHAARDAGGHAPQALRCFDLYVQPRCRAAWLHLGEGNLEAELADIETECRRSCLALSGGVPPRACVAHDDKFGTGAVIGRVATLDEALLQLEGLSSASAADLASRLTLVIMNAGGVVYPVVPDAPAAVAGGEVAVVVTPTEIRIDGVLLDPTDLSAEIARSLHGAARATIRSSDDVAYARIMSVMAALKSAGVTSISLAVDSP